MKGYSRSRQDFIDLLINKYVMKEIVLVTTPDCVKCKFIKEPLKKRCEKNGYSYKEMEYGPGMEEVTSVPCVMIGENEIIDYEGILEMITSK